jgi:hypothetical protein
MQMIDVLSRLAALDSGNTNVQKAATFVEAKNLVAEEVAQLPELHDMSTLRALSGLKPVNECDMMGIGAPMQHQTPASFSINASAASGDEVASMLTQIMNLAGVHKPEVGAHDAGMLTGEPPEDMSIAQHAAHGGNDGGKDLMRSMMDKMNDPQPEDEGAIGGGMGAAGGAMLGNMVAPGIGGALGAAAGGAMGGAMEDEGAPDSGSPVAAMADEVRDMADELADTDKEELGLESYDNTPNSPHSAPQYDANKMAFNPNASQAGDRMDGNMPKGNATFEDQLYAEYKAFVSESEQKTMSRAAKGMMKYGKKGMKALADAGKVGKDLEPVRAKYNKYD